MINLRLFLHSDDLNLVSWQTLAANGEILNSGESSVAEALLMEFDFVEIYLAPTLATIIQIDLGDINDRKINDELLLGVVEENIAEDIEDCTPILLRLTDGIDYVAIVNKHLAHSLRDLLSNIIKKVRFIQPFPYALVQEDSLWSVYLIGDNKFICTSSYEYYLLDDNQPIPELLEHMLATYEEKTIIVYTDNPQIVTILEEKFNLKCKLLEHLNYGQMVWNFYNEKSKRFDIKLQATTLVSLKKLLRYSSYFFSLLLLSWLLNLTYMVYERSHLQNQITTDLRGIVTTDKFTPNLLDQVNDKLSTLAHTKGAYANNDALTLFDIFLRTMPEVNNRMIAGINYSGTILQIFLNSQFNPDNFANNQVLFLSKGLKSDIQDYKTFKTAQDQQNSQDNNNGNALSSADSTNNSTMQDVAWVISLQTISRMDELNENNAK